MGDKDDFNLDDRVHRTAQRNAGVAWPRPVDFYLDLLLVAAEENGDRTTRKELVAAIVAAFPLDPDQIAKVLRSYRRLAVGELLEAKADGGQVIHLPHNGPGPRKLGHGGTSDVGP